MSGTSRPMRARTVSASYPKICDVQAVSMPAAASEDTWATTSSMDWSISNITPMRTLALLRDRLTGRPTSCGIVATRMPDHRTGRPRPSACPGNCRRQRARHARFGQNAPMSVAIVMGSASDASIMDDAVQVLRSFGVAVEVRVISAHRTPDDAIEFARTASANGINVIIAAAGGAAHLAGVLAAATPLPVIGVPIALGNLGGLDSLLGLVQMPNGAPVAGVAVNGARNAGLLAVRIMALSDERLAT